MAYLRGKHFQGWHIFKVYCNQYINYFRNVLAGIIAFGIGCGQTGIPDVFASVQDALCFIDYDMKCKHGREFIQHVDFDRECNTFLFHLFIYDV